jgi:hypothetical protein
MENSHLLQLIRQLPAADIRAARRFLQSPYFNQRTDLLQLFDWIVLQKDPDKYEAWRHLFGKKAYNEQGFRLLMSYLNKLLEQFLAFETLQEEDHAIDFLTAVAYRKRRMQKPFLRAREALERQTEKSPLRNSQYYETKHRLGWELHQLAISDKPTESGQIHLLAETLDVAYLSRRLRLICLKAAQQRVYTTGVLNPWDEQLIHISEEAPWCNIPAVFIYRQCFYMLRYPEQENHFQDFKTALLHHSALFSAEEMHGLYLLAINYCVMRLNESATEYFREVFDLYKAGLAEKYLLEQGVLSRFTYQNIVTTALFCAETDWALDFVHAYKGFLEKKYRDSSFSFSLAQIEFARGQNARVLELLQHANYRDPLLNLRAKTLLMKVFYEMDSADALASHLDAMRNYLHRNKVIGYHKTNYLNLIRYMERISKINFRDKAAVEALQKTIREAPAVSEKEFLLKILA